MRIPWLAIAALAGALPARAAPPAAPPLAVPAVRLLRAIPPDSGWSDVGASVLRLDDGALVVGWTARGMEPADGLVMRLDRNGGVRWRRTLGGAGADLLWAAQADGSGGWILAGMTRSRGAGGFDGWLLALDAAGTVRWERTSGGAGDDRIVALEREGAGLIAAGQTGSGSEGESDAWVLRLDAAGAERAAWRGGGPDLERAFSVAPAPGGGFVIAGTTGPRRGAADGWVTRVDGGGARRWSHTVPGDSMQVAYEVRAGGRGDWLVTGYGWRGGATGFDGYLLRLDDRGRTLAQRWLGGATYDRLDRSRVLADGSIVTIGYSQRAGSTGEEEGWDLVVHALSPALEPRWTGRFGGTGLEFARAMDGPDDDLWIVGHTGSDRDGTAVLVLRLDASRRAPGERGP